MEKDNRVISDTRRFVLTGTTPLLAGQPGSEAVRTLYYALKRAKDGAAADTLDHDDEYLAEDEENNGETVFYRTKAGELCLMDYQVKGYIKDTLDMLKGVNGMKGAKRKADNYLFIYPRHIPITHDGATMTEEDSVLERPIRCTGPRGERVSLTASEQVDAPWQITVDIELVVNPMSKTSAALTWQSVYEALEYGKKKGIGQWRNGGFGRFTWEEVERDA